VKVNEGILDRAIRVLVAAVLMGVGPGVVRGPGGSPYGDDWRHFLANGAKRLLPALRTFRNRHPRSLIKGIGVETWRSGKTAASG
jgi:hypothetical protein